MEGYCKRRDFAPWYQCAMFCFLLLLHRCQRDRVRDIQGYPVPAAHPGYIVSCQACSPARTRATSHGPPAIDPGHPRPHGTLPTDRLLMPWLSLCAAVSLDPPAPSVLFPHILQICTAHAPGRSLPCWWPGSKYPNFLCKPIYRPQHTHQRGASCFPANRLLLAWDKQQASLLSQRLQPYLFQWVLNTNLGEGPPFQLGLSLDTLHQP